MSKQKQVKKKSLLSKKDIFDAIAEGQHLAEIRGVGKDSIDMVHSLATGAFARGDYEFARKAFLFLCLHIFNHSHYWHSLGACFYELQNYNDALAAYTVALMQDGNSPQICFEMGRCYIQLGEYALAQECLDIAEKKAEPESQIYKDIMKLSKPLKDEVPKNRKSS